MLKKSLLISAIGVTLPDEPPPMGSGMGSGGMGGGMGR